jgi:hypothetical protein
MQTRTELIITVRGDTDAERSTDLRRQLELYGYVATEPYEWHNGEPLYHGNPTSGYFMRFGTYFEQR